MWRDTAHAERWRGRESNRQRGDAMSELCKGDPAQTQGYGATLPVKGQSRARVRQMTHFRKVRILNTAQITGTRGRCVGLRRRIWSRKCARKRYSQTRRLNLTSAHTVGCVSTATLILLPSRFSEVRVCVAPYWQPQTIHALCVWCRCLYFERRSRLRCSVLRNESDRRTNRRVPVCMPRQGTAAFTPFSRLFALAQSHKRVL